MHEEVKQYFSLTLKTFCCEKHKRWCVYETLLILNFDKIRSNISSESLVLVKHKAKKYTEKAKNLTLQQKEVPPRIEVGLLGSKSIITNVIQFIVT